MFWPSFNSALAEGATQQRTQINTVLAISGSVMSSMHLSKLWHGKLEMELILNATLAGGVAIGSASDLVTAPWAAILVGYFGGALSSLGFHQIGPYLKQQYGLEDTCGVHSLHGMPGVFAAIISSITIAAAGSDSYPDGYYTHSTANA